MGPSPWAWKDRAQVMGGSKYRFRDLEATDGLSGITKILNDKDETLLLLDFQCYARFLDDATCLLWWDTDSKDNKSLEFRCFSFENLSEIAEPLTAAKKMRERKEKVSGLPSNIIAMSVPCFLSEGKHPITPPQDYRQFEETLALAEYHPGANGFNQSFRAIFVFDWVKGEVQVIPQEWFNHGAYDLGYQWIARVARMSNGVIVGEGVRLGSFELDETGRQVKTWLSQNPFHMIV
jgi:hypothetical protein